MKNTGKPHLSQFKSIMVSIKALLEVDQFCINVRKFNTKCVPVHCIFSLRWLWFLTSFGNLPIYLESLTKPENPFPTVQNHRRCRGGSPPL